MAQLRFTRGQTDAYQAEEQNPNIYEIFKRFEYSKITIFLVRKTKSYFYEFQDTN